MIAEYREPTNPACGESVTHRFLRFEHGYDQICPLIICIPSQIATNTIPSVKSKLTMSISP